MEPQCRGKAFRLKHPFMGELGLLLEARTVGSHGVTEGSVSFIFI